MKFINIPIRFLCLLILFFSISCSNENESIEVKNWMILYEQDTTLQSVLLKNPDAWQPVQIPLTVRFPYPPSREFQYVWLKGDFEVNDDPSIYYGLSTGRIRITEKIFINGRPVGPASHEEVVWNPLPRNYIIQNGLLKIGKNTVYIQLGTYGKTYGGILSDVDIQDEKNFIISRYLNNLIYRHIPGGMVFIFLSLIIPIIIIYLWNRKEKLPIYNLLGLLLYIIHMLNLQTTNRMISYESYQAITIIIIPLVSVIFVLLIQALYKIYLSNYNRIIIPVILVILAIMMASKNTEYYMPVSTILTITILVIAVSYLVFLLYRLNSIKRDRFLLSMTVMMSAFIGIVMIFEFYSEYIGADTSDIPTTFSPMIFLIIFAVLFSREIMKRRMELELLYKKLEIFEGNQKELSITESAEEKLERVIAFITENFTSDISREGLALAVGISPNYMGTLFRTYTGKSINEYINHLRIDEAKKHLESGNFKIIDIAYSVGFENIVTFNRVFKKETGKTPSEYKLQD